MNAGTWTGMLHRSRSLSVLGASLAPPFIAAWLLCYVMSLVLGVSLAVYLDELKALVISLAGGTVVLWGGWFACVLLLRLDADRMRLPGITRAIAWTLMTMFAVTVIAPGTVLAMLGIDPAIAFGMLAAGAAGGFMFGLMPWPAILLPGIMPWLFGVLKTESPVVVDTSFLLLAPERTPWFAVAFALLGWWRWRALVRCGDQARESFWRRAAVVHFHQQSNAMFRIDANHWRARIPNWLTSESRVGDGGPDKPVTAMGSWIGGTFESASWQRRMLWTGLFALILLGIVWLPGEGAAVVLRSILIWIVGFVALMAPWALAMRLEMMRVRPSAEFAELAVLPGWGSAASARRALLRCLSVNLACRLVFVLVAIVGLSMVWGAGEQVVLALLFCGGMVAANAVLYLRSLAGKTVANAYTFLVVSPVLLLMVVTVFMQLKTNGTSWLYVTWVALIAVYGRYAVILWHRVQQRPHPFLLP